MQHLLVKGETELAGSETSIPYDGTPDRNDQSDRAIFETAGHRLSWPAITDGKKQVLLWYQE